MSNKQKLIPGQLGGSQSVRQVRFLFAKPHFLNPIAGLITRLRRDIG